MCVRLCVGRITPEDCHNRRSLCTVTRAEKRDTARLHGPTHPSNGGNIGRPCCAGHHDEHVVPEMGRKATRKRRSGNGKRGRMVTSRVTPTPALEAWYAPECGHDQGEEHGRHGGDDEVGQQKETPLGPVSTQSQHAQAAAAAGAQDVTGIAAWGKRDQRG